MNAAITSPNSVTVAAEPLPVAPKRSEKIVSEDFWSLLGKSNPEPAKSLQAVAPIPLASAKRQIASKPVTVEDTEPSPEAQKLPEKNRGGRTEKIDATVLLPLFVVIEPIIQSIPAVAIDFTASDTNNSEVGAPQDFREGSAGQIGTVVTAPSKADSKQTKEPTEAKPSEVGAISLQKGFIESLSPESADISPPVTADLAAAQESAETSPIRDISSETAPPNQSLLENQISRIAQVPPEGANDQQPQQKDRPRADAKATPVSGTATAKERIAMKPTINGSEVAEATEQKLPGARGMATFVSNTFSGATVTGTLTMSSPPIQHVPVLSSVSALSVVASASAVRTERLYQCFLPELALVKTVRPDSLSVVLKPDRETEIFVRVTFESGQMRAYARCDRGDFGSLHAEWGSLQKSLAAQGVELGKLNEGAALARFQGSESHSSFPHQQSQFQRQPETDSQPVSRRTSLGAVIKGALRSSKRLAGTRQLLESWA